MIKNLPLCKTVIWTEVGGREENCLVYLKYPHIWEFIASYAHFLDVLQKFKDTIDYTLVPRRHFISDCKIVKNIAKKLMENYFVASYVLIGEHCGKYEKTIPWKCIFWILDFRVVSFNLRLWIIREEEKKILTIEAIQKNNVVKKIILNWYDLTTRE